MAEENTNYTPPVYPTDKQRKAIPTFIGISIIVIVAVILFGGVFAYQYYFVKSQPVIQVQNQTNQAVFNWEGTYEFTEVAPGLPNSGQPNMVENYVLSILSGDGRWYLGLNVDGFQSLIRIVATANNVGKSLDVVFDSYNSLQKGGLKGGDVMFTLTPTPAGLAIQWKKMQPNFSNTDVSNSFFVKMQTAGWKTYTNSQYGFKINFSDNWAEIPTNDNKLKINARHSSGCTLSYGDIDTKALGAKYFVRYFDEVWRIFYEGISKNFYIGNNHLKLTSLSQRYQNGGVAKYSAVYIDNFPEGSTDALVLQPTQGSLSDKCITDFLDLVTNKIEFNDSLYSINQTSTGVIERDVSFNSVGLNPEWDKTKTVLVFKNQNGNEKVLAYIDLYNNSSPQMQLSGNKIYFVNLNGGLSLIDLKSKQIQDVNLLGISNNRKGDIINDFLLYDDNLYYLTGKNCNYYMAECNLTLYRYNSISQENVLVAKNITDSHIMGYNATLNKLYFSFIFADAGGCVMSIAEYDLTTKKMDVVASGSCGGDGATDYDKKIKQIEQSLSGQINNIAGVTITTGDVNKNQSFSKGLNYDVIRYVQD